MHTIRNRLRRWKKSRHRRLEPGPPDPKAVTLSTRLSTHLGENVKILYINVVPIFGYWKLAFLSVMYSTFHKYGLLCSEICFYSINSLIFLLLNAYYFLDRKASKSMRYQTPNIFYALKPSRNYTFSSAYFFYTHQARTFYTL